jgi:hypothetical protein
MQRSGLLESAGHHETFGLHYGVGRREIFGFSCTSTLVRPRGPRARVRRAGGGVGNAPRR